MTVDAATVRDVRKAFDRAEIWLVDDQEQKFAGYLEVLERWNQKINLTAIRDRETAIRRHLVEPGLALPLLGGAGPTLLDVGSGAGIPGLPLKILEPERTCYLVEANNKKATFLREVVDALGLEDVIVLEGRLEELVAVGELTGPVHLLTARAWTEWGPMLGLTAGLMAPGGRAVLLIGEEILRALRRNLSPRTTPAGTAKGEWAQAATAGWEIRRVIRLAHLDHGYAVSLELPSS